MQSPVINPSINAHGVWQIIGIIDRLPFDDVSALIPDSIRQTNEQINRASVMPKAPESYTSLE